MTDLEFGCFFVQIVTAGNDTTRTMLSSGLLALLAAPRPARRVARRPVRSSRPRSRRSCAGRTRCTTSGAPRPPTPSSGGQAIAAGDKLALMYTSANRDEDVFADPHRFDIRRDPNPHLSFGIGEHFCLGVHLARLEGRVFFEELLDTFPVIELTGEPRRQRSNLNNALKSLPVRLGADSRRSRVEGSAVGVGTSSTGIDGGGPQAIAALENADASATVNVSSTSCPGVNSASQLFTQLFRHAAWVLHDHVGELHRETQPVGQLLHVVRLSDLVDEVLGQSLLLRTCEAEVPSNTAVDDPGVAQPARLLGRLVDGAVAPQRAVEAVEGREQLRLVVEEALAAFGRFDAHVEAPVFGDRGRVISRPGRCGPGPGRRRSRTPS